MPHAPRPAGPVVLAVAPRGPHQAVAREDQQGLEPRVAAPGRPDRPHRRAGAPHPRGYAAVRGQVVVVREPPDVDRHRELRRGPRADAGHGEQARVGFVALEQRRRLGLEGPGLVEGLRYPGGQEPDLPVLGLDERRRGRRRTARRARPPCCGRGRWPAPPRRGRSGRPSATTCRRPGRARPRVWWMALSRWYPSGSRSTGWPPPRHSHYQPRHLPGTFLSAVGGGASRAGSTQRALSGGRDVRPCAGARSAARSGRASIVARDGPGLTISTVMDVLK